MVSSLILFSLLPKVPTYGHCFLVSSLHLFSQTTTFVWSRARPWELQGLNIAPTIHLCFGSTKAATCFINKRMWLHPIKLYLQKHVILDHGCLQTLALQSQPPPPYQGIICRAYTIYLFYKFLSQSRLSCPDWP